MVGKRQGALEIAPRQRGITYTAASSATGPSAAGRDAGPLPRRKTPAEPDLS